MKITRIALYTLLAVYSTRAAGQISGKVTSAGRSVPFVQVRLVGTNIGTYTNDSGLYQLSGIDTGVCKLVYSSTGYRTEQRKVVYRGTPIELNVSVTDSALALDEVAVTGVARSTIAKRSPVPIAIVTRKDLNKHVNSNIIDALTRSVPGMSGVTTGPNITKPFIRGLGYNRVLTMFDGIRQEGQQWGDEHGIEVDQYGIERAEVVKGPASLIYGSDAVAGVINLIPYVPKSDGIIGNAIAEYQTNNGMACISAGVAAKKASQLFSLRLSAKTAHDYHNPVDGYVYNTGYREYNFSGSYGIERKNIRSRTGITYYDNLQEIPDGSRDSLTRQFTMQTEEAGSDDIKHRSIVPDAEFRRYTIAPLHQHIQHIRAYNHTTITTAGGELVLLTAFQQNRRREYTHPRYPSQPGLSLRLNTLNYDVHYNFAPIYKTEATIGLNGMYQQNRNMDATDYPVPDHHLLDGGIFLFLKRPIGRLEISGGIRYDVRHTGWADLYTTTDSLTGFVNRTPGNTPGANAQYPAFQRDYSGVSGSVGVTWNAGRGILVKGNVARGYRAPNITEIGSNGLDPGAHIVYLGNRTFEPEFTLQEDIGFIWTGKTSSLYVELFNNDISNYIYQARKFDENGAPVVIVPGNATYQYNQSAARIFGAELGFKWNPKQLPWLTFGQSVTYTEGRNNNSELSRQYGAAARYLPLIPPAHFRTDAAMQLPLYSRYTTAPVLTLGLDRLARQDKVYAVDNAETPTAGYTLLSCGLATSLKTAKGKTVCHVSVQADNLLNTAWQSHLNRLKYFEYYAYSPTGKYGIYNQGRNIAIKAEIPLGK